MTCSLAIPTAIHEEPGRRLLLIGLTDSLTSSAETSNSTSIEFDQLAFWDDREADPALNLTPMLKDCVSNSALLLVVMSPGTWPRHGARTSLSGSS